MSDAEVVARQIGRTPRAFKRVAVRCPFGKPAVTEQAAFDADGHPFYGSYVINADGSVTIDLESGERTLPAYMVLPGPNPTGHAIYWYKDYGTARIDYCFSPGTLS